MITISFLEEIDGEPTPSPRNDAALDSRRLCAGGELGPRGPAYFMPEAALLIQPATVPTAAATPEPPKALLAARQLRLLAA